MGLSVRGLKRWIKGWLKSSRLAYERRFQRFSKADFARLLRRLGVEPGDAIIVHSSATAFEGFNGKITDAIAVLIEVVGEKGHVAMPNQPFDSTAVAYARTNPVFKVATTPSRMGLLTEMFRRTEWVKRSVHPTHPVAVAGPNRDAIVADAHLTRTPCGRGSVYERLGKMGGKIVLLGVDVEVMTFYHFLEEELEPRMPHSPFTQEEFELASIDESGRRLVTRMRLLDERMSRARRMRKAIPDLKKIGAIRTTRIGTLVGTSVTTEGLREAVYAMCERGEFCYDL